MKMKTFMKKSMALLLTVLMLLSTVATGAVVFTASAEDVAETNEATAYKVDGTTEILSGTFAEGLAAANANILSSDDTLSAVGTTTASELDSTEDVTVTVKDKTGDKTILEMSYKFKQGETLPWTGAVWNNGTQTVTEHVSGTTSYTVTWETAPEVLYSADSGVTYSAGTLADAIANNATDIELLGDLRLNAVQEINGTIAFTFDGNGFTIDRSYSDNYIFTTDVQANVANTRKLTFKNIVFSGKINGEAVQGKEGFNLNANNGYIYFVDCDFIDFNSTSNNGAIYVGPNNHLYLVNVTIERCKSNRAAVCAGVSTNMSDDPACPGAAIIYLEGNTNIESSEEYPTNRICFQRGALALSGDFTGKVDVWVRQGNTANGKIIASAQNDTQSRSMEEYAKAANGATISGIIRQVTRVGSSDNTLQYTNLFAYVDEENSLRWTDALIEDVTVTVKDKTGDKTILEMSYEFKQGETLPWTGAVWNNGTQNVTSHVFGTKAYTVTWNTAPEVLYSADKGATYSAGTLANAITNNATHIELLGDLRLNAVQKINGTIAFTFDGNGFTIDRSYSDNFIFGTDVQANVANTRKLTFKNIVFSGKINGEAAPGREAIDLNANNGYIYFVDCDFIDFNAKDAGRNQAAIYVGPNTHLYLVNVDILRCVSNRGAVSAGTANNMSDDPACPGAAIIYLEGNTNIESSTEYPTNRICFTRGALALAGDFTGKVDVWVRTGNISNGSIIASAQNDTVSRSMEEYAKAANGATISGKIRQVAEAGTDNGLFAYVDEENSLRWTDSIKVDCTFDHAGGEVVMENGKYAEGAALTAPKLKVTEGALNVTFEDGAWYYNNGEQDVQTNVVVAGVTEYFVKYTVDTTSEAYILRGGEYIRGTMAGMIGEAKAGETVELLKGIEVSGGTTLDKKITLDGNGHTITAVPNAETKIYDSNMFYVASAVTFKNITLHGGAKTEGVWEGPISGLNRRIINVNSSATDRQIVFEDCTIRGFRGITSNNTTSVINVQSFDVRFTGNTVITDNMYRKVTSSSTNANIVYETDLVSATQSIAGVFYANNDSTCVTFEGNVLLKDNYAVYQAAEDAEYTYYQRNYIATGSNGASVKRTVIGELKEGSDIYFNGSYGYIRLCDENGVPYPVKDYVKVCNTSNAGVDQLQAVNYILSRSTGVADEVLHTANNGMFGVRGNIVATHKIVDNDGGWQGNLDSDKLNLKFYIPVISNDETTVVRVSLGGKMISETSLSDLDVIAAYNGSYARTDYGYTIVTIPVGMAQLTDEVEITVIDNANPEKPAVVGSVTAEAKEYLDLLLDADANIVSDNLKTAIVSLLQFGAKSQIVFNYNTGKLADDGDYTAYSYKNVDKWNFGATASSKVTPSVSGSVEGITVRSFSLILENQISLRVYFNVTGNIEDYSITIGSVAYSLESENGKYYIDIKDIMTKDLAQFVEIVIVKGSETMTLSVSPMCYVQLVNSTASLSPALKDTVEALYYYFDALLTAFNCNELDITGFEVTAVTQMRTVQEGPNVYSAPYKVEA